MCTARKGVKDLPISAQSLPAVFMAEWRNVLDKSGCWERNAKQSLSVTPMEPHGQALQKHGG